MNHGTGRGARERARGGWLDGAADQPPGVASLLDNPDLALDGETGHGRHSPSNMRRAATFVIAPLLVVATGALLLVSRRARQDHAPPSQAAPARYSGSARCRDCHEKFWRVLAHHANLLRAPCCDLPTRTGEVYARPDFRGFDVLSTTSIVGVED